MEVLNLIIRPFWGWVLTLHLSLTYTAKKRWVLPILGTWNVGWIKTMPKTMFFFFFRIFEALRKSMFFLMTWLTKAGYFLGWLMLKIAYSQQKQWVVTAPRDAMKFEFGIPGSGGSHLGPRGRGTRVFHVGSSRFQILQVRLRAFFSQLIPTINFNKHV